MYNSVIFDFNGTLLFDTKFHDEAWRNIFNELTKTTLPQTDLEGKIHGVPNVVAIEKLFPSVYTEDEKTALSLKKEQLYRDLILENKPTLVPGSTKLFNHFKNNEITFTIASASIKENIDFFYQTFSLFDYFDYEKIVYDNGSYHNKIQMFLDALEMINGQVTETIIFEDSISGVNNAIAAGFSKIILIYDDKIPDEIKDNSNIIYAANNFYDVLAFLIQQK